MPKGRRLRPRRQRQLFVVAVEGKCTEPAYFAYLQNLLGVAIKVLPPKGGASAPDAVLKRLRDERAKRQPHRYDRYWVVIDRDAWTDEQLAAVRASEYSVAVSNPCFEAWILAHYEAPAAKGGCTAYQRALGRHLPGDAHKNLRGFRATTDDLQAAVARMQAYVQSTPEYEIPDQGGSEVWRLVAQILDAAVYS